MTAATLLLTAGLLAILFDGWQDHREGVECGQLESWRSQLARWFRS